MLDSIEFNTTKTPDLKELLEFYDRQHHKITQSSEKLQRMVDNTFCFITAHKDGELIGITRAVTDGLWGCLAECKLDPGFQGPACVTRTDGRIEHDTEGIAFEMARLAIHALRDYGVERIEAVAYGTEVDFCEELGFKKRSGVVNMVLEADTPLPVPAATTMVTSK